MSECSPELNPAGPWHRSRWLRNGLLLPLWFLNAWLLLRLLAFLQPFLTIFVFALVLALLLEVPVCALQRWGVKRGLGVLLVVVAVMAGGSLVLALVLPPLVDQGRELLEALPSWLDSSAGLLNQIQERVGIPPESAAPPTVLRGVADKLSGMAGGLMSLLPGLLTAGLGAGLMTFLTVILTVFILVGGGSAWMGLMRWLPPWWRTRIQAELPTRLGLFLQGQVAIAAGFALVLALVFSLIGVPFGALVGIAIGMASLVPFMGAVAQVGGSLFLMVHDAGMGLAVFVISFLLGQIVDNAIVPRVMGNLVGLNPLWLLLTVFLGGKVAGIPGILVSIPIASTIRSIAEDWLAEQQPPTP